MPQPPQPKKKAGKAAGALLAGAMAVATPTQATMNEIYTPGFEEYLKDVEGFGAGLDNKTKLYHPYPDIKGNSTIGVGHKILGKDGNKYEKGITEEAVHELLRADVEKHMGRAKSYVDVHFGTGAWRALEPIKKQMLTDYAFNPGLGKFPKFTKAVVENDWERAYMEMNRYAVLRDEDGNAYEAKLLKRRNEAFYENFLRPLREEEHKARDRVVEGVAAKALEG
jgi:GH24 family phage-related lysozyme (muramidase)